MNRLYLLSWYYQGRGGESDARGFFENLRGGLQKGKKFPFDCPSEVGLVHCAVDEHWCVGVLVMRGTAGDDSVEQTDRLHRWFEACDADFSGTDRTGERVTYPSVEGTLQSRYGSHYTCVEAFDPLSIVPEDKNGGIESKPLSMDSLSLEDKVIAADPISSGDDNVPLSQPVKETIFEAESPQSFQGRFSQQEWETLQLVFIWVFRMTFGIIRKSDCLNLDEKTMAVLGMVIARAPELENDLAREVLVSLAGNFESIWMRCLDDPRLPHEALEPVAQLLQNKVSPEDARGFKQAVLIMTRVVAKAAGRTGQEAAVIVIPATILYPGASTDEILSEIGMTTSRSIYKEPPASSAGQAVAQTPSGPASSPSVMPVVTATPGAGQAEISPALNAVIQKYMSKQYMLVSRTGTSAVLKRQAPVNWGILVLLLIVFWIGAIIYLIARKKYQVTLVEQADGSVAESGGTLEEYECDRAREARSPKSAYVLMIIGALLGVTGGLFGLILLLAHRADPVLSQDPAATVTTLLLCPTPIVAIGLLMLVGGFLIHRRAARPVVASSESPRSQVSFTEKDNLGTYYDTASRGESYWRSRMMQGADYPFVIYYFDNEKNAREALLELPCIHVAQDSLKLICTEVLDFGYYPAGDGAYAAFICGNDLTHDLWEQAKTSFGKHNGTPRNEQEPEKRSAPVQQATAARPDKVVFVKEMRGQNQVGGGTYIKKRYSAPDAASAKAFLQQHPVTEQFYYIEIETPEGNFGRDIQGIYTY